jgi:hypothetical protein
MGRFQAFRKISVSQVVSNKLEKGPLERLSNCILFTSQAVAIYSSGEDDYYRFSEFLVFKVLLGKYIWNYGILKTQIHEANPGTFLHKIK